MYLAPIVRARPATSPGLRFVAGAPVMLMTATVMLAWLVTIALITAFVLGIKTLVAAPRTLAQAIDHAGRAALGR